MQDALPSSLKEVVRQIRGRLPSLLFGGFSFLAIFLFYAQPELRQHVDNYFFDLQTRLKPQSKQLSDVVVVPIDAQTLHAYGQDRALSGEQLVQIIDKLRLSKAAAIVLLLPENVLDYESAPSQQIIHMIQSDERFTMGVLGYHQREPSLRRLPRALVSIKDRVFGIDMLRRRSNDVVRKLSYTSYLGLQEQEMLPVAVAHRFHSFPIDPGSTYLLNFEPTSAFITVNAAEAATAQAADKMAGNIVVLGYTVPVPWPYMTYEQMNANSPLRYDLVGYLHGESLTVITANAIENLLHDRSPTPLPWPLRALFVAAMMVVTFWLWRRGTIPGSLWVTVGFWVMLMLQSIVMGRFAVDFPAADVLLFGVLASMLGAWQALQHGLRRYADDRSLNERNRDIAQVRSEFLDRFADELSRINQNIAVSARQLVVPAGASPALANARRHLHSCTEEFADYIAGVVQVSRLSVADRHPELSAFDLAKLVEDVAERFALTLDEKAISLEIVSEKNLMLRSNKNVVDKILFNFLSNAVKYSPNKTTLTIRIDAESRALKVHVIDQGHGIAEEHQELIFEKFYRVRNDDTYRIKGSGLGLYLCRYFAGLIGARIELDSKIGVGSDFVLVLPR